MMTDALLTPGIKISLNGVALTTESPTLHALLEERGYALNGAFACAINNRFVPRTQWAARTLAAGDRIDVITPIAGG